MYLLYHKAMSYLFAPLLSMAVHSHCCRVLAFVLLADLAWGGPEALAQTLAFNGQQTTESDEVLYQPYGVVADVERNFSIGDMTANRVVEFSAGGGTQTIASGAPYPSFRLSYAAVAVHGTAVLGLSLPTVASMASSPEHSLLADTGSLSTSKSSFSNGALPFEKVTTNPGLSMNGGSALGETQLHVISTLLGRPAVDSSNAQTLRNVKFIGENLQKARYWTLRRKIETAGVTLLHMADAAQTCWHEANTPGWHEQKLMTPRSCEGASVVLVGSGPILQWATYLLTKQYPHSRLWARIEHVLPQTEIFISAMSIKCSNASRGCNQYGF